MDTANLLADTMGVTIDHDLSEKTVLSNFVGSYGGQTSLPARQDALTILESDQMKDWTVTIPGSDGPQEVDLYDLEAANGIDPYAVYLQGNPGIITIENPHGEKGRELIVFRDSFGSSLIPLIASGYEKVIAVDLRNCPSWQLDRYIDFHGQDCLFLFSTSVLNDSASLK